MQKKKLPPNTRVYAIGDVHGRSDLLARTFRAIDEHCREWPVETVIEILLGDYIDRGPDSKGVLDLIIDRSKHRNIVALAGNHEQMLLEFWHDPQTLEDWLAAGGLECLLSYGINVPQPVDAATGLKIREDIQRKLPAQHLEFVRQLRFSYGCGDYLFVHAGIKPTVPIDEQSTRDLLWIRRSFLDYEEDFGVRVVHGHTPVQEPDIRPNRINIDTGAFMTGRLTCLVLEGASHAILMR